LEAAAETGLYKELPGLDGKKERVLAARAFPFYQLQKRADIWAAFIHMISLDSAEAHRFLKGWKLPGKVIKQALLTAVESIKNGMPSRCMRRGKRRCCPLPPSAA
jgi:tRNA nucleotidyltransferase (CCA-adding enzyme)